MFNHSDGGRSGSGFKEKRDCTVRAFAVACGIDYAEAHRLCKKYGRKDRKSFVGTRKKVQAIIKEVGWTARQVCRSGSLGKLREKFPRGRMFILKSGHAFAMIDGIQFDTFPCGDMTRIKGAWLLEKFNLEELRCG